MRVPVPYNKKIIFALFFDPAMWREEETGLYVGSCPAFNITTYGPTADKAFENLNATIQGYLQACAMQGLLRIGPEIVKTSGADMPRLQA